MSLPFQDPALRELHARYAPAEALLKKRGPNSKALGLDGEVLSQALYKGETGVRAVEAHHRALFASTEGQDLPALLEFESMARGEYAALKRTYDADAALHARTNPTVPAKDEESAALPWDGFDLFLTIFYFGIAFTLMAVGIRGMALVLEESGLAVFSEGNVANRFLFSFVLVGLATVLKATWSLARTDSGRANTARIIAFVGIVAALAWAGLFADAFGGSLSTELPDYGETPSGDGGGAHGGKLLLWLGVVAEAFIAASCWIQASCLLEKHRPPRECANPKVVTIAKRMDGIRPSLGYLADLAARLHARIEAIKNASAVFVSLAVATLKNAFRKTQRYLLAAEELESASAPPDPEPVLGSHAPEDGSTPDLHDREQRLDAANQNGAASDAADDPHGPLSTNGDADSSDNSKPKAPQ